MDNDARHRDLLQRLLDESPYRRSLRTQEAEIARVALSNVSIREALDRILADPDYATTGRIDRRRLGAQLGTVRHLHEWIYFASDSFVERARLG